MRNTMPFQTLVKGQYGRKIAYTNVEEINAENVASVIGETLAVFMWNKRCAEYLWNYYLGDQPSLYRTKTIRDDVNNPVVENHAYELVQFKNGQSYGEPIACVALSKDDAKSKAVDTLNDYCRASGKYTKDLMCGEWQSAVGMGFKGIQRKPGKKVPFRLVVPTPLDTYIVYNRNTQEPVLAVQESEDSEKKAIYHAYDEFNEYIVQRGEVILARPHVFGGIPIVEYPNNQSRLSDIEIVITMLDAINSLQSNRVDAIEQFVQSYFKFINCDIDAEKFEQMKKLGAFAVNSNDDSKNADVDLVTQELNQQQSQVVKDDLWNNVLNISAVPNKEGNTGGDTQGAVELRNGWDFSKTRANVKDAFIKDSEKQITNLIINVLRQNGINLGIDELDYEAHVVHSPTDNLQVKTQSLQLLLTAGIHPLVAIRACGLWSDSEKVYLLSKPYLDNLYKTIDEAIKEQNLQSQLDEANKLLASQQNNGAIDNGAEDNNDTAR